MQNIRRQIRTCFIWETNPSFGPSKTTKDKLTPHFFCWSWLSQRKKTFSKCALVLSYYTYIHTTNNYIESTKNSEKSEVWLSFYPVT